MKSIYLCVMVEGHWKIVNGTTSFQTQNYHFSNIDKITHLSEVNIVSQCFIPAPCHVVGGMVRPWALGPVLS